MTISVDAALILNLYKSVFR